MTAASTTRKPAAKSTAKPAPKPAAKPAPKPTAKPAAIRSTVEGELPASPLDVLRAPFPAAFVSKLPKQLRRDDQDRGRCEAGSKYSADGVYCGGWHARSLHLDYVGHADVTARLLEADPAWDWEPLQWDADGFPKRDREGGMWIKLTVAGVTRLGYGDAQGKSGPNAIKEVIGDALRNAAMRFGVGLDLWSKADAHAEKHAEPEPQPQPQRGGPTSPPRPAQPPQERPAPAPAAEGVDWLKLANEAPDRDALSNLWQRARAQGAPTALLDAIAGIARSRFAAAETPADAPSNEAAPAEASA